MDPYNEKNQSALKCIWMTAGVVNYKLCDQNFECDKCEFNRVMQGVMPSLQQHPYKHSGMDNNPLMLQYLGTILENCKIHLDRYYHSTHFWFKIEDSDTAQVGIDPLSLRTVFPVEKIILPDAGEHFQEGQLIAWIVRKDNTIPLHTPVKGEITEVNPVFLVKGWEAVQKEGNYLFKMQNPSMANDIKRLCGPIGSMDSHQAKISVLKSFLLKTIRQNQPEEEMGVTMGDGGTYEKDLENIMGKKLYRELIQVLFYKNSK
ncbi:MAG: hypothetical protein EH225_00565 [Calditrichaeota bacterium]|nr:hypothetical protein [Calditrichota bacterium]RQW08174.1 MAG: hypothetical protein EH225_00565 [Calditrichota bacterium]